jgi:general nucleoside transport system permease protein
MTVAAIAPTQRVAWRNTLAWRVVLSVVWSLVVTGILILMAGKNPLVAYQHIVLGAFGSWPRVVVGLNKAAPYMLAGVGVALCFRGNVANMGAEGQIAIGGLAASVVALIGASALGAAVLPAALIAGVLGGAAWAAIAAAINLTRGVHEVLVTLMMNFIAWLIVAEFLHGPMGEIDAGFPQTPMFENVAWLPKLVARTDLHIGIVIAVLAALVAHVVLWRTVTGFRWRLAGASDKAAHYAGVSRARSVFGLMLVSGVLSGMAGAIEVLGVHYRLIEGFSLGFGFNAIAIALLATLKPLWVIPAALFFAFLETGALSMQRQIGIPSSLVLVIQGLSLIFVLCAVGRGARRM